MYKKILLALDGSMLDDVAIGYGLLLAKAAGGQIVLVQAVEVGSRPAWSGYSQTVAISAASGKLEALAQHLRFEGVSAESHLYSGDSDCAICHEARVEHPDVVVMPASERSMGCSGDNVIEQVLRLVTTPVLLLSPDCRAPEPGQPLGPIIVPLDGSRLAEQALEPAGQLARALGVELLLLETVEPPWASADADVGGSVEFDADDLLDDVRDYLTGTASRLRVTQPAVAARTEVHLGVPARVLEKTAAAHRASAIAVSVAGVAGSLAADLMEHSKVPLLMCPSADSREKGALTIGAERIPLV